MTFGHEEALQLCCATEACWLHLELVILYSKNGTHLKIKKDEVGVKRKSDPPTEKYEAWIYFLIFYQFSVGKMFISTNWWSAIYHTTWICSYC